MMSPQEQGADLVNPRVATSESIRGKPPVLNKPVGNVYCPSVA